MIYNLDNTIKAGRRCRIYDANGLEWTKVLEADTETGRIVRYYTDDNGCIVRNVWTGEGQREIVHAAAPLVAVFDESEAL